jgi:PhzF family phenazine biosynthesis protein
MFLEDKKYFQVDVFGKSGMKGNPVAVFFGGKDLSTEEMQKIATWMNLSETTFVLPPTNPKADYKLRIFDPVSEMKFAGHPTLGSAKAFLAAGHASKDSQKLIQECQLGLIEIFISSDGILSFELPSASLIEINKDVKREFANALKISHEMGDLLLLVDVGARWVTGELKSKEELLNLRPDMPQLAAVSDTLGVDGVTLFAKDQNDNGLIEVRSFAPAMNVNEDPVCGSGNASVGFYILKNKLVIGPKYTSQQGRAMGRNGELKIELIGERVRVGGATKVWLSGEYSTDGLNG